MENPPFWWSLPGKMRIFMGYVSFGEGVPALYFLGLAVSWRSLDWQVRVQKNDSGHGYFEGHPAEWPLLGVVKRYWTQKGVACVFSFRTYTPENSYVLQKTSYFNKDHFPTIDFQGAFVRFPGSSTFLVAMDSGLVEWLGHRRLVWRPQGIYVTCISM